MVLFDAVDELIGGMISGGQAVATAKHLLLQAVRLPSCLVEAVVEVIGDVGARFQPRLVFDRIQVELTDRNSVDTAFGVDVDLLSVSRLGTLSWN